MTDTILTPDERTALKSMAKYWDEVSKREDTNPLYAEVGMVANHLGVKLLWIIEAYLEQCDIEEAEDKCQVCEQEGCPRFGQPLTRGECK